MPIPCQRTTFKPIFVCTASRQTRNWFKAANAPSPTPFWRRLQKAPRDCWLPAATGTIDCASCSSREQQGGWWRALQFPAFWFTESGNERRRREVREPEAFEERPPEPSEPRDCR